MRYTQMSWIGGEKLDMRFYVPMEEFENARPLGSRQIDFLRDVVRGWQWWVRGNVLYGTTETAVGNHNWAVTKGRECRKGCPVPEDWVVAVVACPCGCSESIRLVELDNARDAMREHLASEVAKRLRDDGVVITQPTGDGMATLQFTYAAETLELGNALHYMRTPESNAIAKALHDAVRLASSNSLFESTRQGVAVSMDGIGSLEELTYATLEVETVTRVNEESFIYRHEWDPNIRGREFGGARYILTKTGWVQVLGDRESLYKAADWLLESCDRPEFHDDIFVGNIVALRQWSLSPNGEFLVGTYGQPWRTPVMHAKCEAFPNARHKAPYEKCHCGIYGITAWKSLYFSTTENPVLGLVRLSGKVIVARNGYRAETSEIILLVAPTKHTKKLVSMRYDVPVLTYDEALELRSKGISATEYIQFYWREES